MRQATVTNAPSTTSKRTISIFSSRDTSKRENKRKKERELEKEKKENEIERYIKREELRRRKSFLRTDNVEDLSFYKFKSSL